MMLPRRGAAIGGWIGVTFSEKIAPHEAVLQGGSPARSGEKGESIWSSA
jgi:hypothetical protein